MTEKNIDVTIRESKTLSDGWLKLTRVTYDLRRNDGEMHRHVHEVHDHGDAVTVLLFSPVRKTLVLIRQFRLPPWLSGHKERLWEACAGLLDEGEKPQACARREILEETGYRIDKLNPLGKVFSSPGSLTECMYLYLAETDDTPEPGQGGGIAQEGEDIEVFELPARQVLNMAENGEIMDAKTLLLVRSLQARRPEIFV